MSPFWYCPTCNSAKPWRPGERRPECCGEQMLLEDDDPEPIERMLDDEDEREPSERF